jgi:hypothetical protein
MADTTNNRMELTAAIEGLRALKRASQVTVLTDSEYVRRGITEYLPRWKTNGWRTSSGKAIVNQDLWEELEELSSYQKSPGFTYQDTQGNRITNVVMHWPRPQRGQRSGKPCWLDWRSRSLHREQLERPAERAMSAGVSRRTIRGARWRLQLATRADTP